MIKLCGLPHSEIPGYASTRLTEAYRSKATSFIGPRRQGIHPAPLKVCAAPRTSTSDRRPRMRAGHEERGATRRMHDHNSRRGVVSHSATTDIKTKSHCCKTPQVLLWFDVETKYAFVKVPTAIIAVDCSPE